MNFIIIDGRKQRFCQQCGKFHELNEFDGQKKSCKRKLKRHNERRRSVPTKGQRWQSDSDSDKAAMDSQDEAELLAVANMKRRNTRTRAASLKTDAISSDDTTQTLISRPISTGRKGNSAAETRPSDFTPSESEEPSSANHIASSNATDRNDILSPDTTAVPINGQSSVPHIENMPSMLDIEEIFALSDSADDILLLPDDISDSLVLSTGTATELGGVNGHSRTGSMPQNPDAIMDKIEVVAAVPGSEAAATPGLPQVDMDIVPMHAVAAPLFQATDRSTRSSAYAAAQSMIWCSTDRPLLGYSSENTLERISFKVFGCMPEDLLPGIRAEFDDMIQDSSLVEGYLRPGCVHLTLSVRDQHDEAGGLEAGSSTRDNRAVYAASMVSSMLQRNLLGTVACNDMIVDARNMLVVVKRGKIVAVIDAKKSSGVLPSINALRPLAVVQSRKFLLTMVGPRLNDSNATILARQGGRNLTIEMLENSCCNSPCSGDDDSEGSGLRRSEFTNIGVLGADAGCIEFEAQRGAFVCPSRPLLVVPDQAVVDEIRQVENSKRNSLHADDFLRDMGFVIQYLYRDAAKQAGHHVPAYTHSILCNIETISCRLVAACVAQGWPACVKMLLPAVAASGRSPFDAIAAMDNACPGEATLLHVAVGTGCPRVIDELAWWANSVPSSSTESTATAGQPLLAVGAKGPAGITPLHVAAVLPPEKREEMRAVLVSISPLTDKLWNMVQSDDGSTPDTLCDSDRDQSITDRDVSNALMPAVSIDAGTVSKKSSKLLMVGDVLEPGSVTNESNVQLERVPSKSDIEYVADIWSPLGRPSGNDARRTKARMDAKRRFEDRHMQSMVHEVQKLTETRLLRPWRDVTAAQGQAEWAACVVLVAGASFTAMMLQFLAL